MPTDIWKLARISQREAWKNIIGIINVSTHSPSFPKAVIGHSARLPRYYCSCPGAGNSGSAPGPNRTIAQSHIKDVADFEGVRENLLVGYGLVVGLNGSGDTLTNSAFTKHSLVSMLERLGISTRNNTLKTANVAAVMVTSTLPPFARSAPGSMSRYRRLAMQKAFSAAPCW